MLVSLVYEVADITSPTKMYHSNYFKTGLKRIVVDGETVSPSNYTGTWQFNKTGKHVVHLFYSEKRKIVNYEYANCADLVYANLPETVYEIEDGGFSGCTHLYSLVLNYPGKVALHETSLSMSHQIWSRSLCQNGSKLKEVKVVEDYVADYRESCGTTYGALYIMPIGKSIKKIDWGNIRLNEKINSNGSTSFYDFTKPSSHGYLVPALTDYIEIPSSTTKISYCSGNLNYYTPYINGAFSIWYLVSYDENKQVIGSKRGSFSISAQEVVPYTLPEGTKYIRFDMLWQNIDSTTFEPYDGWVRYAHVKDAETQEIIWPKVTYA